MLTNLGHRKKQSNQVQQLEHANLMVVHDGKGCPVDPRVRVRVLHRDGGETSDMASEYVWPHVGSGFDIVAYRLIEAIKLH